MNLTHEVINKMVVEPDSNDDACLENMQEYAKIFRDEMDEIVEVVKNCEDQKSQNGRGGRESCRNTKRLKKNIPPDRTGRTGEGQRKRHCRKL